MGPGRPAGDEVSGPHDDTWRVYAMGVGVVVAWGALVHVLVNYFGV